jgi:septum formation protein
MASPNDRLILASASAARACLLSSAGVDFAIEPARIDETAFKRRFHTEGRSAAECAAALAEAKARSISARHPRALVIGADQLLVCGSAWFDKPEDVVAARRQLWTLRGRTHVLETAVCAVRGDERLWGVVDAPQMTMREFTEAFLDGYLAAAGRTVLGSVGAYRLEGEGIQLFERIEGDYFSILGLPLIPLLALLRAQGQLPG